MAKPNDHGGWDLTDEDLAEVMETSFGSDKDKEDKMSNERTHVFKSMANKLKRVSNGDGEEQEQFMFDAALLGAFLSVGVYVGGGRHLKKIARNTRVSRDLLTAMASSAADMISYVEMKDRMRIDDMKLISQAYDKGIEFQHFPGLGVFLPGGMKSLK